jgi:membrane-associated phospholipid phosphatase
MKFTFSKILSILFITFFIQASIFSHNEKDTPGLTLKIDEFTAGSSLINSESTDGPNVDLIDTDKTSTIDNIQDTSLFSESVNQTIKRGGNFSIINLNSYLYKKNKQVQIIWEALPDTRIHITIDSSGTASLRPIDENWIGSDTIIFKAYHNNKLIQNQIFIITVISNSLLNTDPIKPIREVLNKGINDILNLISSPLRWDSTDFFIVPAIALGTYTFMLEDQSIHNFISNNGTAKKNTIMDLGTDYGEVTFSEYSSLAVFSYGLIFKDNQAVILGLEMYESYFIANNITSFIKRTFGRRRPYESEGPYSINSFLKRPNALNSFPSGHATLAFSLSSVLAAHTSSFWLKSLFYAIAGVTAISRVYYSDHWFSDVFMGGTIGYSVGSYLVNVHNSNSGSNFNFDFDDDGRFSLKFNF